MKETSPSDVWSLRGISVSTRELFKQAADSSGVPVGTLANRVLRQSAHQILNLSLKPEKPDPPKTKSPDAEIESMAASLRALDSRVGRLEKAWQDQNSDSGDEDDEVDRVGSDLLLRILRQTQKQENPAVGEKLVGALMSTAKLINDPLTTLQVNRLLADFRANSQLEVDIEQVLLERSVKRRKLS